MRKNRLEEQIKERANEKFLEMTKNMQECMKIGQLENWTEISKYLYMYETPEGGVYEIVIREMGYDQGLSDVQADLYLAAEWHDRETNRANFTREYLKSGTVKRMVKTAQANLFYLYDWDAA